MEYCSEERDLGVIIKDTSPSIFVIMCADLGGSQCAEACKNANRILGLIKGTFVVRSTEAMVYLYKTMVRPHLEYCVSASS